MTAKYDNRKIKICEMSPRDGLQNEIAYIDTKTKIDFINKLSDTGLRYIEVSSFVNPKRVPQLVDAADVFNGIARKQNVSYSALVPNDLGVKHALKSRPDSIAVFTTVSESFSKKNINCSISESLQRFLPVIKQAQDNGIAVRAYISCVLGCPYEGFIQPTKVADLANQLINMGCYEISLGDTIGAGTANQARQLIKTCTEIVPHEKLAIHFHDTRGQALANILACVEMGIRTIDTSVAGLGGCPYAKGATGNVATEDVVYMLQGMSYETGIDLDKLILVGQWISQKLKRVNSSRTGVAGVPYEYTSYQNNF